MPMFNTLKSFNLIFERIMPVSVCPHCKTQLWVTHNQMNVANGFVKCSQCSGLLQAKHFLKKKQTERTDAMQEAVSDAALVSKIGLQIRQYKALNKDEVCNLLVGIPPTGEAGQATKGQKSLSKAEIADLLDNLHADARKKPASAADSKMLKSDDKAQSRKSEMNWTLAVMVALTVLILQLFYLLLMN